MLKRKKVVQKMFKKTLVFALALIFSYPILAAPAMLSPGNYSCPLGTCVKRDIQLLSYNIDGSDYEFAYIELPFNRTASIYNSYEAPIYTEFKNGTMVKIGNTTGSVLIGACSLSGLDGNCGLGVFKSGSYYYFGIYDHNLTGYKIDRYNSATGVISRLYGQAGLYTATIGKYDDSAYTALVGRYDLGFQAGAAVKYFLNGSVRDSVSQQMKYDVAHGFNPAVSGLGATHALTAQDATTLYYMRTNWTNGTGQTVSVPGALIGSIAYTGGAVLKNADGNFQAFLYSNNDPGLYGLMFKNTSTGSIRELNSSNSRNAYALSAMQKDYGLAIVAYRNDSGAVFADYFCPYDAEPVLGDLGANCRIGCDNGIYTYENGTKIADPFICPCNPGYAWDGAACLATAISASEGNKKLFAIDAGQCALGCLLSPNGIFDVLNVRDWTMIKFWDELNGTYSDLSDGTQAACSWTGNNGYGTFYTPKGSDYAYPAPNNTPASVNGSGYMFADLHAELGNTILIDCCRYPAGSGPFEASELDCISAPFKVGTTSTAGVQNGLVSDAQSGFNFYYSQLALENPAAVFSSVPAKTNFLVGNSPFYVYGSVPAATTGVSNQMVSFVSSPPIFGQFSPAGTTRPLYSSISGNTFLFEAGNQLIPNDYFAASFPSAGKFFGKILFSANGMPSMSQTPYASVADLCPNRSAGFSSLEKIVSDSTYYSTGQGIPIRYSYWGLDSGIDYPAEVSYAFNQSYANGTQSAIRTLVYPGSPNEEYWANPQSPGNYSLRLLATPLSVGSCYESAYSQNISFEYLLSPCSNTAESCGLSSCQDCTSQNWGNWTCDDGTIYARDGACNYGACVASGFNRCPHASRYYSIQASMGRGNGQYSCSNSEVVGITARIYNKSLPIRAPMSCRVSITWTNALDMNESEILQQLQTDALKVKDAPMQMDVSGDYATYAYKVSGGKLACGSQYRADVSCIPTQFSTSYPLEASAQFVLAGRTSCEYKSDGKTYEVPGGACVFTTTGNSNDKGYYCDVSSLAIRNSSSACGCPSGMTLNAQTDSCDGVRMAALGNFFTLQNLLIFVVFAPIIAALAIAYIRR
jgi:hypothetical protein